MAEDVEAQALELLIHALRVAGEKPGRKYKYFKLHVCHECLHEYVADYMVLGFAFSKPKPCELCGSKPSMFEVLFAKTTKRRLKGGFERVR